MIRLVIRTDNAGMAANVGGAVLTTYTTLDVELPALEALLTSGGCGDGSYSHVQLVGCEILPCSGTTQGPKP